MMAMHWRLNPCHLAESDAKTTPGPRESSQSAFDSQLRYVYYLPQIERTRLGRDSDRADSLSLFWRYRLMYGVVLMAALATSAPAPGFHHRCHGCSGYSSGCHGCYGYAGCHGCYGSYGCYGCYGSAWGGPWAGAYTGWNYGAFYCTGCYGCYGGYSCYGSPYAGPGGPTYVSPGLTWPNNPVRPPLAVTPTPKA